MNIIILIVVILLHEFIQMDIHDLYAVLNPFVINIGWDFLIDIASMNMNDLEEAEWLLRWLTAGYDLPMTKNEYGMVVWILAYSGHYFFDYLNYDSDVSSNSSYHPSDNELEYATEDEDEGLALNMPPGLYRQLFPRPPLP